MAPIAGGYGGVFSGTLAVLETPSSTCAMPGDGHAVIQLDVPTSGIELGAMTTSNVQLTLWQGSCGGQAAIPCGKNNFKQPVPPGSYLLEVTGQGAYTVTVGMRDSQSGACLTPDADHDTFTVCNGDCNDGDASVHPNATETCNGVDDDCDGMIDDLRGSCSTGLPGACNQGQLACAQGGGTQCTAVISANQIPEYCGDGIDNNCNNQTDEAGCTAVAVGEICSLPIDIGSGGSFSGDLTHATDDVSGTCSGSGSTPDHVYKLTVPAGPPYVAEMQAHGQVFVSILSSGCGPGFTAQNCFDATKSQQGPSGPQQFWLDPGTYYLVIEGTGPYGFDVGLRNSSTGSCLTPDGDGDGYALCNGDCDDQNPNVHPTAVETCNAIDDDCNGVVDDVSGSCNTGLPGICQTG
ncbi:MAG: putative metal-binding motif-containing protein, partial [Acidimicrobiia bacterium]